jgi:ATP-GRASP peptide maturase of grasp-with-spasm system
MILIFTSSRDRSSTDVMRWLHALGNTDVVRVNDDDRGEAGPGPQLRLAATESGEELAFQHGDRWIHLGDIEAVWYRKGRHWLCRQFAPIATPDHPFLSESLERTLQKEELRLTEVLHAVIERSVPTLGSSAGAEPNKLMVLGLARAVGLAVPPWWVVNRRGDLEALLHREGPDLITKPLSDGLYVFDPCGTERGYFTYTERLDQAWIASLADAFPPTLVQRQILKRFDLRVFVLERECYAMAILSQGNPRTEVDFRHYDEERPNRCVPYRLPKEIEERILRLLALLKLNTGSVDLIVDRQGTHVFLEVNPVGQFGMVSEPCNYHLEYNVAAFLSRHAPPQHTSAAAARRARPGSATGLPAGADHPHSTAGSGGATAHPDGALSLPHAATALLRQADQQDPPLRVPLEIPWP